MNQAHESYSNRQLNLRSALDGINETIRTHVHSTAKSVWTGE